MKLEERVIEIISEDAVDGEEDDYRRVGRVRGDGRIREGDEESMSEDFERSESESESEDGMEKMSECAEGEDGIEDAGDWMSGEGSERHYRQ